MSLFCNLAKNLYGACLSNSVKSTFGLNLSKLSYESPLMSYAVINVRYKHHNDRVFRKIRGGGRPLPQGVIPPEPKKYGWRPVYPEDGEYTTRPLPIIKMGGRDPETGKVVVRTIGGGHKKKFRWVDFKREARPDGGVLEERVLMVRYDPCRTARIALVATEDHKRWIIASEFTKVGDIIRTSGEIPRIPICPVDGDAYPIGALPISTMVHCIETTPGSGAIFCRAAGSSAQLVKKVDNKCIIQLPHKRQVCLDEKCMVVVGRVSNPNHGSIPIGSPNRMRWLGKRPRSGLWHRKDGYCGRKVRPPKSMLDMLAPTEKKTEFYNLTFKE
ncbi:large ribosomal subunit protein uL2m [Parasteatoda tepidariorum]|uniref:large ribosomal subunit protein uL2m n=1 Tax=Parasteatoda tepidariorum TaxID=114398 RepID=UPI00077FCEFA|nr:39S ribosomal protein L2, mitochondrial [Parasteatoda tepidariorum]XP_015910193.1 39S ribosomal protein L2, mitochondrial [Parasteatoda tepidariorum]